jgi:hypothetical protein
MADEISTAQQLKLDSKVSTAFPEAIPGQTYTINGFPVMYKGVDRIVDQIDELNSKFPGMLNVEHTAEMLRDPLGFKPTPFQLDPSITHALAGNISGALNGPVGAALNGVLAGAGVAGGIAGLASGPIGAIAGGLTGGLAGAIGGALGGGLSSALGGMASNFLPPGLSAPMEAFKGAIGGVMKQLPIKGSGAADIVNKITEVKALMNIGLKGPGAIIFAAMKSNLLSDIPGVDALKNVVNLQSQVSGMMGAISSGPAAFAAQAASIHNQFPMIDVNAIASKMVAGTVASSLGNAIQGAIGSAAGNVVGGIASGVAAKALGAGGVGSIAAGLAGAGFNINSMVPNMNLSPGGIMKMLPIPGMTPTKDAKDPAKTNKPPDPVKPLRPRNLFAEASAGSAMADLSKPLSQFMGLAATIAPMMNMIADSPAKTSAGAQKLGPNANTANWGSGGYGYDTKNAMLEKKRMEASAKIEKHTQELMAMIDYSKLSKYSYPDLIKKYPGIKPNMSVIEALHIIEITDAKSNMSTTTV